MKAGMASSGTLSGEEITSSAAVPSKAAVEKPA